MAAPPSAQQDTVTRSSLLLAAVRQQAADGVALETELGAKISQLRASVKALQVRNEALIGETTAGRRARDAWMEQERALQDRVASLVKGNGELTKVLNQVTVTNKRIARRLGELERSQGKLLKRLFESEKKGGELTRKLRAASEQLAAAKARRTPAQIDIDRLTERLQELEAANAEKQGSLDAATTKLRLLESERQAVADMLARVKQGGNDSRSSERRVAGNEAQEVDVAVTVESPSACDDLDDGVSGDETNEPEETAVQLQSASDDPEDGASVDEARGMDATPQSRDNIDGLRAEVSMLKAKLQELAPARSAREELTSETETLRAMVKQLNNQLRAANAERHSFGADRLVEFMERTFACTGTKELLRAAFAAFYDRTELGVSSGGRFAPKPVLLVHQVEVPQTAASAASALALAAPAVARKDLDDARSADSTAYDVRAVQPATEGNEKKQGRSGGDDLSNNEHESVSDPPTGGKPEKNQPKKRGRRASVQDPQVTGDRAEPPADAAAPMLSLLSNPRRSAVHHRALAPRLDGTFEGRIGLHHVDHAPPSSQVLPAAARDRADSSREINEAIPAVLVQQRAESADKEAVRRTSGRKKRHQENDDEEEGDGHDRRDGDSSTLSGRRRPRTRSQKSEGPRDRLVSSKAKRRRTSSDAADVLTALSSTVLTRARALPRAVRFQPTRQVGTGEPAELGALEAAVSVNEIDLRILYEAKPWEAMYEKRPLFSYTVDYSSLSSVAKKWLESALAFRHQYRRQLWEQQHWVVVARPDSSPALGKLLHERTVRQTAAQFAWSALVDKANRLIRGSSLGLNVWHDPFLWQWPDSPRPWLPRFCNLVEELEALDEAEPARCFYVNCMRRHPFFTGKLAEEYPEPNRLPPGF